MTIPLDAVAICNLALDHLKQAPIVNIESPTTQVEELMARQYPQARRATLRMHPFNFASHRVALTADPDSIPVAGYSAAFRKPNDFLRFLSRIDSDGISVAAEYDLEGDFILMDAEENETVYIRYTRDITIVSKMDPLFIDLLAVNLALRISSKFSGSEARAQMLMKLREDMLRDARAVDGQERPPRKVERSAFLSARRGTGINARGRDQRYTYFN